MSPTLLVIRSLGLASIAMVIALLGGVSASFDVAGFVAIVGAILYTIISELLLRRKLFGKIGGGPIRWYADLLINETALAAVLNASAFALFGWTAGGWVAIIGAVAGWLLLTWDTLRSLLSRISMFLDMHQ